MAQLIKPTTDARQTFTTVVGSQKIRLNLAFLESKGQDLDDGWYADLILLTDSEEVITQGERLNSNVQLGYKLLNDFEGAIIVVPITSPVQDLVTIDAWGTTHQLVYFTQAELDGSTI